MESSLHDTVYAWLQTSYWNHLIPYDPIGLAEDIVQGVPDATATADGRARHFGAKNMSALGAWVLSEAAFAYPDNSIERTAIVAAVGYLLANIRASHPTYLHPAVFPFGKADLDLLDQAEEAYKALAIATLRVNPNALDHIRPMIGTVRIHVRGESGRYEHNPDKPTIPDPPAPWTGKWSGYPLE